MLSHASSWPPGRSATRCSRRSPGSHSPGPGRGESWAGVGEMLSFGPIAAEGPGTRAELGFAYAAGARTIDPVGSRTAYVRLGLPRVRRIAKTAQMAFRMPELMAVTSINCLPCRMRQVGRSWRSVEDCWHEDLRSSAGRSSAPRSVRGSLLWRQVMSPCRGSGCGPVRLSR
jgi:hypothetical protein